MRTLLSRSLLIVAIAASAAAAQGADAFNWSKTLPSGARLTIMNVSGPIEVRAATGDRVEVRATVRPESRGDARDVTFQVRDRATDDVQICTVYQNQSACDNNHSWDNIRVSVRYTIDLPKSMRLKVVTGNGAVSITQTVSDVDATSGNGDVTIKESLGRVTANTGNGDVTITSARGPVNVRSGNGRINAATSRGPVDAITGNGDIDVSMAALESGTGSMTFRTGSGHIRVALPSDFNGELNANTGNGSITSDFEIRVQGRLNPTRLRGTIGNGNGPSITLHSGNGRLEVRKY